MKIPYSGDTIKSMIENKSDSIEKTATDKLSK